MGNNVYTYSIYNQGNVPRETRERKGYFAMGYTKEDIVRIVKEEKIDFVRMQFVDIFGQLKNVVITASQVEKAINNQIAIDGSSIEGFVRINESDQYLYPDLNSFVVLPWQPEYGKVARLICDVHNPDGTAFVGDPRGVLHRVIARAKAMGYDTFNIGPEMEFFMFETDERGNPTTHTNDEVGYFDLGPLDRGEPARREMCLVLEQMGFEIEAVHHEVAAGQHEIGFKYAEALKGADNVMTFKLVAKTIAQKHKLHATFMPKPIFGVAGNGMHMNMSLFKNGENVFFDANGPKQLSETAYQFIAGLLAHVKGFTAITNPLVNSYKRLVPGYEAPLLQGVVRLQPFRPHPHPGRPGQVHPAGAAQPRPLLQPLSGGCGVSGGRSGRHREEDDPAPRDRGEYLRDG